jgi:hypothetical protein
MPVVSAWLDVSDQQRFAILMIVLSVAIFVAVRRDETER